MASSPEPPRPDHTCARDGNTHNYDDSEGEPEERKYTFARALASKRFLLSSVFIDGGELLVSL
jgi:hypothetical protein